MKLTASIVTYNTDFTELARCLHALKHDGAEHVYVIDNSPADLISGSLAEEFGDFTEDIPRHDNPGYGSGHNIALRRALDEGTRYHLVLNSDVYFDPGVLPAIAAHMDSHPEVGMLQPQMVFPDGKPQFASRLLPTPFDLFARFFFPKALRRRVSRYLVDDSPAGKALIIPYLQGSFMFLRVDTLRQTGIFDERYFLYLEDIDLSRRIHAGHITLYWPDATICHIHRAASHRSLRMFAIHTINMCRYFNKWGWFFDRERRNFNRCFLKRMHTPAATAPLPANDSREARKAAAAKILADSKKI